MQKNTGVFVIDGFELKDAQKAFFHYKVVQGDEQVIFTEELAFPEPFSNIPDEFVQRLFQNIAIVLGISYYKIFCLPEIQVSQFSLTQKQADFWNTVYKKGLGEFFYKNQIDFRNLIHFLVATDKEDDSIALPRKNRSLVLFGGGKDSLVTVEALKKEKKPFAILTVNPTNLHKELADKIDTEKIYITRTLDPKLFDIQNSGYKGHVPSSAMNAFISFAAACFYDYQYVIASNEASASIGNVAYLGSEINHQWSKSLEFETLFQAYTSEFVTPEVTYFSLLRPFSEFKITEMFSQNRQYFAQFSSCNTNFKLDPSAAADKDDKGLWCGKCPKCAFVFVSLAAFLPKAKVIEIFGKNLLADPQLVPVYEELLGISGFKPFECVGTPEETQFAFYKVWQKKEYADDVAIKLFENKVLANIDVKEIEKRVYQKHEHRIPKEMLLFS
ncbi:hypothetical protein C4564_01720 [Candidatus Microgenomates bacterium]|nr:MAG: hypothetical protein C4564_01720 [Candidatus Microgenomates bacterium]